MSPFDIPFTKLAEPPPEMEIAQVKRKPTAKRGANPEKKRGPVPGSLAAMRAAAAVPKVNVTPPRVSNWKEGVYKPDLAMRLALDRAREAQPAMTILGGSPADGAQKEYPR